MKSVYYLILGVLLTLSCIFTYKYSPKLSFLSFILGNILMGIAIHIKDKE